MTDETGALDTVEFMNIAKDDALAWPAAARRTYPSTVNARMDDAVVPFIRKSIEVNDTLLDIFNELLGLPAGTLAEKHKLGEFSGSEARLIKNPPRPGGIDEAKAALAAHTDFGSLVGRSHAWFWYWPMIEIVQIVVVPSQQTRRSTSHGSWNKHVAVRQG